MNRGASYSRRSLQRDEYEHDIGDLQPGQYARLRVLLAERGDARLVPQAAVQESQGSASVFVVGQDQKVQPRTVRMGPRFGTLWVVEDGVTPGEHVVVKGLQQIRAGTRVEPTVEAIPPEPAAPEGTAHRPAGNGPTAGS